MQTILLLKSAFLCVFRFFGLSSFDTVTTLILSRLASFLPFFEVIPEIFRISAIKEANKEEKKPEKISLFDKEFEIGAVKGALAEIGVSINKNAGVQAITNKLGELTEEQNKALSEILCKE